MDPYTEVHIHAHARTQRQRRLEYAPCVYTCLALTTTSRTCNLVTLLGEGNCPSSLPREIPATGSSGSGGGSFPRTSGAPGRNQQPQLGFNKAQFDSRC